MRVLFVPVFNYASALGSDSIYLISGEWCRAVCDADPEISFYRLLPNRGNKDHFRRYSYDYEPVHPRVHDVFVDMYSCYAMEEANAPWDIYRQFHPFFGDLATDAVICTSAAKMVHVKPLLGALVDPKKFQRFFNFELLMRGHGSREVKDVTEMETMLQSVGETMGFNLFQSPTCKRLATKTSRKFVTASMVRRVIDNSAVVYSGYDAELAKPSDNRFDRFSVVLRGRLSGSKNADRILALYSKFSVGRDIRILVTTGNRSIPSIEEERASNKAIEFHSLSSKKESVEMMRECHAFVFWSSHELFAVSVWEMFGAGLIGVIKRAEWIKGLIPDDYPYVFDSEDEAFAMLVDIHDNYEARYHSLVWMFDYVRSNYAYECTVKEPIRVLKEWQTEKIQRAPRDWLVELMQEHGAGSMGMCDMEALVQKHATRGKLTLARETFPGRVHQAIGSLELVLAARAAGYVDNLESREICVEKRDS